MTISANVVLDSISGTGKRITTLELVYPRFIHSELMTHRAFSRNSASSRAIPVERMIAMVQEDTAMPIAWGKNTRGMQAKENLPEADANAVRNAWLDAALDARRHADELAALGAHKQIANRVLEPFMHMTTLVTATEWENFFTLRDHPDAQPEIQALAKEMRKALGESSPTLRMWHMPFVHDTLHQPMNLLAGISAARCARVSYLNHDGTNPDIEKDLTLARRLAASGHWSPFEHVACANLLDKRSHMEANFQGWKQLRHVMAIYPKWLDTPENDDVFLTDLVVPVSP